MIGLDPHTGSHPAPRASTAPRADELHDRLTRCLAGSGPPRGAVLAHLDVAGAWDVKDVGGNPALGDLRESVASTLATTLGDGVTTAQGGLCGFTLLLEGRRLRDALEEVFAAKEAIDELRFTWQGHPFRLWAHAGVLELRADRAPARRWLARAREACAAARDLAGRGVQVVECNDHAWGDIARKREWVQHLSEIIG